MSNRDTQFAGFAKHVIEELTSLHDGAIQYSDWWQEQAQRIMARRAYDLAGHVLDHTNPYIYGYDHVPDFTACPETSETDNG